MQMSDQQSSQMSELNKKL